MPRVVAATLALVLVLAACTGGGDDGPAKDEATPDGPAVDDAPDDAGAVGADVAALLPEGLGYQDVHLILDVEVVGADGSARSIMEDVLELASRDLGPALAFGDGAELRPSSSLVARIVDQDLGPMPSIDAGAAIVRLVDGGGALAEELLTRFPDAEVAEMLAEADGADGLLVYSTADLSEAATDVTEGDRFVLDLTELDSVAVGDRLQVSYGFARTVPGDGADGADDPAEVLATRWAAGAVEMLSQEGLRGSEPVVMVDDAGEVTEGSSLGGWGAKSGGAFDYLPRCLGVRARSSARSPWRSVACVMTGGYRAARLSRDAWGGSQSPGCTHGGPDGPSPVSGRGGILDGRLVQTQDGGAPPGGGGAGGGCPGSSGDPHLRTFDGHRYSLMAVGEYVLARSDAGHVIQARFEPVGRRASLTRAVAVDLDGTSVMVRPERSREPVVRVDGEVVDLVRGEAYPVGEGAIVWTGPSVLVLWPDGTRLYLTIWSFLNVELSPSPDAAWDGLLGTWDGDPENDIQVRDGDVLGLQPTFEQLYREFAPSWAVSEDDTLFQYEPGESVESFRDDGHPEAPRTLADHAPEERAEAEATCAAAGIADPRGFQECVLDLLATGDPDVVAAAALWSGARILAGTSVTGVTTLAGFTTSGAVDPLDGVIDGRGRLLTRLVDEQSGAVALLALDGRSALPVARWDDVVGACVPGVDADGRTWFQVETDDGVAIAVVDPGRGAGAADDSAADPSDKVAATFVPDRDQRMDACRAPIAARADGGVVVVHRGGFTHTVEAFDLAEGEVRRAWRTTFDDLSVSASDVTPDGRWVTVVGQADEEVQIVLLDAADGTVRDTVTLAAGAPSRTAVVALDDVAVVTNADGRKYAGSLLAYDLADGRLAPRWQTDTDPDGLLEAPIDLVANGDLLVSWYPITERIVALDADDGSLRWTATPDGFARIQQLAVTPDGDVLLATSRGGIEALGPDGQLRQLVGPDDGIPSVGVVGPIDLGGRVHVFSTGGRDEPPRWYRLRPPAVDAGPATAGTAG